MTTDTGALRVVEIASGTGASYAARDLLALGASVTKLVFKGQAVEVSELDLNKVVVTCDVDRFAEDCEVQRLLADADVVLRACPASDVDSGPFAMSELRARNTRLVTAAITPFGESGPLRDWQSTDLVAQQSGGLGYITPPRVTDVEKEHPLGVPGDIVEPLTGLVLVLGILNALLERDGDGLGRHVEVSAQDAVASLMFNNIAAFIESGKSAGRRLEDNPGARRPFLPASDGQLVLMASRRHHLRSWLGLLGDDARELVERLDQGAPLSQVAATSSAISDAWTSNKTRREVTDIAQANHVPMEPALNFGEVLECPQLEARGFWESGSQDRLRLAGHPFGPLGAGELRRLQPSRVTQRKPGPWLSFEPGGGPLTGVRVVDFTWVFAGPIASRILAALGATVVKVEMPGAADEARPFLTRTLQSGKKSTHFDLKDAASLEMVRSMALEADVVIENFSTGVMERLGLGWEALRGMNPGLTMVSISGMGRTGPYAHHAMFGQLAQAYSGITSVTGYEGGPLRGIEDGGFWSDPVTGYAAAAAVLSAIRERSVTGKGRRIDVSLVEATVSTMFKPLLAAARGDVWQTRGNFHPGMAPHDVYRCAPLDEDRWFALAVRSDAEWAKLCGVISRRDLIHGELATLEGSQAARPQIREAIESWSRSLTADAAASACQAAGIPAAPCATTRDVVEDAHLLSRGVFIGDSDSPAKPAMMALPWRLHPEAAVSYAEAPMPGEHTASVIDAIAKGR